MARKQSPFVKSNYARVPGDFYPTVDPRCVWAFLECFKPTGLCVDPCAPQGSGIVTALEECGYQARGLASAELPFTAEWIITNPPYLIDPVDSITLPEAEPGVPAKRPLVDEIIALCVDRIAREEVMSAAFLLRPYFDFAVSRDVLFDQNPYYFGEIKMRFRPRWKKKQKGDKGPIHHFVWHIWTWEKSLNTSPPIKLYANGARQIKLL